MDTYNRNKLQHLMLNKAKSKNTYCLTHLYKILENAAFYRDKKQISGCLGMGKKRRKGCEDRITKEQKKTFGGDKICPLS